jgi:hypothetical protein
MRMRWNGHVERMRVIRNTYKTLVGKPEGKEILRNLEIDGSTILKLILGTRLKGVD